MRIIWGRQPAERNVHGKTIAWHDVAHCVARYAEEDDHWSNGGFVLEQEVDTLFGRGLLLRIDDEGYLGVLLEPDQSALLYFRHTLCHPST